MIGALRAMRPGSTWIDTSSNAAALAEPLRALAAERGVDVLDAPVGGGVSAARDATLAFYGPVGGELLAVALLEEEAGTLLRVDGAVTGSTEENGLPSV